MSIGETVLFVIRTWLFYVLIAGVLTAPIVFFGRRRVHWLWWETLVFIVPVFIWMALMLSPLETGRKSIANLGEYVFISLAVPIAAFIRVALGKRVREGVCAGGLFALVCLTAGGVFWLTPPVPGMTMPNQAMELTASRHFTRLSMTSNCQFPATRALPLAVAHLVSR